MDIQDSIMRQIKNEKNCKKPTGLLAICKLQSRSSKNHVELIFAFAFFHFVVFVCLLQFFVGLYE